MAHRSTTPPSRSTERGPSARRVDVGEWAGGVRLSGFMVIMLGLVVLGVFVLAPTVATYVGQRQQLTAMEHSVRVTEAAVAELKADKAKWSDPNYLTSQARARLYYVQPGEVVYLVDNDLPPTLAGPAAQPLSDTVQQTKVDWMGQLVRSVTESGLAAQATAR